MKRNGNPGERAKAKGLEKIAQARAAEQSALVAPDALADAVRRFVEWEAYILWVRAIVAAEGGLPEFVVSTLRTRCPGFLESTISVPNESLWSGLLDWVEVHVFRDATCEGWLDAVTYTARRQRQSRKAWRLWQESERKWRAVTPAAYPSFEDWLARVQSH